MYVVRLPAGGLERSPAFYLPSTQELFYSRFQVLVLATVHVYRFVLLILSDHLNIPFKTPFFAIYSLTDEVYTLSASQSRD